jgi:hypothetical protein
MTFAHEKITMNVAESLQKVLIKIDAILKDKEQREKYQIE